MTELSFVKMHGLGNDYVFVDDRDGRVDAAPALARRVSDRHEGVGGDGLILLLRPTPGVDAHVRMRIFNADGSEAEMCGNGIRCLCKLAHDHGVTNARPMRVETAAGVLELEYTTVGGLVEMVSVDMGRPELEPHRIPVTGPPSRGPGPIVDHPIAGTLDDALDGAVRATCGLAGTWCAVGMGNPHLVLFCADAAAAPLDIAGPRLERHPLFPQRVNVHFATVTGPRSIVMRTWERGSGATRACGTGAAAVLVAAVLGYRTGRDVTIHLPGGDLGVRWDDASDHVYTTGPAVEVFSGVLGGVHLDASPHYA